MSNAYKILDSLTDKASWKKKRADNIEAARRCKEVLTDANSYWKYPPDHERVKEAVGTWISRARRCHAIFMGREPVIDNFIYIDGADQGTGPLFVRERK